MKIKSLVGEDTMVRAFLLAEIHSPRFSANLKSVIVRLHATETIITEPSEDLAAIRWRRRILRESRPGLFNTLPDDIVWYWATLEPADWSHIYYINQPDWRQFTSGSRLVVDSRDKLGESGHERLAQRVQEILYDVSTGKALQPLILISQPQLTKYVILEGHARATAYASTRKAQEVLLGVSVKADNWGWW